MMPPAFHRKRLSQPGKLQGFLYLPEGKPDGSHHHQRQEAGRFRDHWDQRRAEGRGKERGRSCHLQEHRGGAHPRCSGQAFHLQAVLFHRRPGLHRRLWSGRGDKSDFRMDVDSDATPKEYGINSEIKYTDVNGDTVISESMKIPVNVSPASSSLLLASNCCARIDSRSWRIHVQKEAEDGLMRNRPPPFLGARRSI